MDKRLKFLLGLGIILLLLLIVVTNILLKRYQKQILAPETPIPAKTFQPGDKEEEGGDSQELPEPIFPKEGPSLN
ncbi:MAG: hypothetical protein WC658_02745 [Candidatus Omnitrophota bacterium]